jgi:hypothetical protein
MLPQGHDLKPQVMTRPNEASQPSEQRQHQPKHESVFISRRVRVLLKCPHAQHFGYDRDSAKRRLEDLERAA